MSLVAAPDSSSALIKQSCLQLAQLLFKARLQARPIRLLPYQHVSIPLREASRKWVQVTIIELRTIHTYLYLRTCAAEFPRRSIHDTQAAKIAVRIQGYPS
ncbi:hypothetical protein [Bradyrhizobium sp. Rc2d]|uniref:hypothetical protein n=1 Tax=Bradyrhizobium sp. Rc2d TaxID=1855321 RepID=UPI00115F9C17|nr:hypothetical protein [Bradyrhizobium sp. Rc2d]